MDARRQKRKPNWTQKECLLLAQLVEERKAIIRGKSGNGITSKSKRQAWEEVALNINTVFPLVYRTNEECEKRWYNILAKAKEQIEACTPRNSVTGGSPVPNLLCPVGKTVWRVLRQSDTSITGLQDSADPAMVQLVDIKPEVDQTSDTGEVSVSSPSSSGVQASTPEPATAKHAASATVYSAAAPTAVYCDAPVTPTALYCTVPVTSTAPTPALLEEKLLLEMAVLRRQENVLRLQEEYYSLKIQLLKKKHATEDE